ncbi:MAG TPA: hypothetical protein VN703_00090 [Candidatus Sulfopaludibacter sp.]|jgi:hypothetical protein|nr:hypothetical protein [Candidatus Sulfopaludibacter sp.]
MNTKTTSTIIVVMVAAVGMAISPSLISSASASITPGHCTNHNGDNIGPSCPGSSADPGQGHTQTCNSNPTGKCPGGQNK